MCRAGSRVSVIKFVYWLTPASPRSVVVTPVDLCTISHRLTSNIFIVSESDIARRKINRSAGPGCGRLLSMETSGYRGLRENPKSRLPEPRLEKRSRLESRKYPGTTRTSSSPKFSAIENECTGRDREILQRNLRK